MLLGGEELDLLRIVHVACRLADVLGYDVTRPVIQLDYDTVLWALPPLARARMIRTPAELCSQIEKGILEFDSDHETSPAPEPAPAVTEAVPVESIPPASIPAPAPERRRSMTQGVLVAVGVLVAMAIFLFWKLP